MIARNLFKNQLFTNHFKPNLFKPQYHLITKIKFNVTEESQRFSRLINFDANYFDRVPIWLEPMDPAMVAIKDFIVYMNNFAGLPWWAILMISSVIIRISIFPLVLVQMKRMSKFGPIFPIFVLVKDTWKKSQMSKWQKIKMSWNLYRSITKQQGLKFSTVMVYNIAYYPILISMIFAIRKLLSQPDIANSSFLYLNNLSDIDPYYILPTLTIGMYYWNFQRFITPQNKDTLISKIRIACQYFLILWYPFLCCWPSGIVIYMCTNAFMSIMQANLMKKPWFLNKIAPEVVQYNYILTSMQYDKGVSDSVIESIKLGEQNFRLKAIKQEEIVQQTQKMIAQLNADSIQQPVCKIDAIKSNSNSNNNEAQNNENKNDSMQNETKQQAIKIDQTSKNAQKQNKQQKQHKRYQSKQNKKNHQDKKHHQEKRHEQKKHNQQKINNKQDQHLNQKRGISLLDKRPKNK